MFSESNDKLLVLHRFSIEEDQTTFEEVYHEHKALLASIPGHLDEILVRSTIDYKSYVIISIWQTENFYQWLQSTEHATTVKLLERFGRKNVHTSKYNVIESIVQEALLNKLRKG